MILPQQWDSYQALIRETPERFLSPWATGGQKEQLQSANWKPGPRSCTHSLWNYETQVFGVYKPLVSVLFQQPEQTETVVFLVYNRSHGKSYHEGACPSPGEPSLVPGVQLYQVCSPHLLSETHFVTGEIGEPLR